REVAGSLQSIRHHGIEVHRGDLAQSSVAAEEKDLVLYDRAAEGRTEVINMQWCPAGLRVRSRVEIGLAVKLEDGAVYCVCAGLGNDSHNPRAGAPVLRAEVIRLDDKLLHRIRIGQSVSGVAQAGHAQAAV